MLSAKNAAPLELDPASTALIIVDMQRYFTQPAFPFTDLFEKLSPGVCSGYLKRVRENVIPSIQRLLDQFRRNGSLVVFTAVGTETQDGSDLACWARALDETALNLLGTRVHPPVGDPSWQIDPALEPRSGEIVVNKLSAGTFATTDLASQ
jgi:nicotinamidase-related amidase